MRLEILSRRAASASTASVLARNAWKLGLGIVVAALLTARGASDPSVDPHGLASSVLPTNVPCGTIQTDAPQSKTATWTALKSPYGTGSPYNLPVNQTNNADPNVTACDAILVPEDVTLKIDASQGPVQIFSHGAGITVQGGHFLSLGASAANSVLFDAEPDVASWDGITITASDASHRGTGSLAYTSLQHALTSISINSGASSTPDPTAPASQLPYGLAVINSGIGPSYFDGIDATNTPILVKGNAVADRADGKLGTVNNIGSQGINVTFDASAPTFSPYALRVESVAFGSSVPFAESSCPPLQPCAAGSIGNDAIVGTFVPGRQQPVYITQSRFYRAGSFGIDLGGANQPVITHNNFDCNGSGSPKPKDTCVGSGLKYSAVHLSNVTADLENSVIDNKGHEDGLDAIVFNGTISSSTFTWINAKNDALNDQLLGYLFDGTVNMAGGTFKVPGGSIVKAAGGPINLVDVTLEAGDADLKIFTSLRDKSSGVDANCSVFVQVCDPPVPIPAGEWGGIDLIGSAAKGTINNATILYATTGVRVTDGKSLVITKSRIGPTFADGVLAERTPLSITGTTFGCPAGCTGPAIGNHGVVADLAGLSAHAGDLKIGGPNPGDGNRFQGSVNEAIRGVGLAGQTVDLERNAIENAGASGSAGSAAIYLQGADNLTLKTNAVTNSGTGGTKYPAIWLDGLSKADFGAAIKDNNGAANGLDAIAFHGDTSTNLDWKTIGASTALGYLVDGDLTVNGDFNLTSTSGDYAPVLGGRIEVKTGRLTTNGAVLTSLKEQALHIPSCGSVFVPRASGVCPVPRPGDWGGLKLDPGKSSSLTGTEIRYARTGIAMDEPAPPAPGTAAPLNLVLTKTSIRNALTDGISTHSPLAMSEGAITSTGGFGIYIDLGSAGKGATLSVDRTLISGTLYEGLLGTGLKLQAVTVTGVTVNGAGRFGISLTDTQNLTLSGNTVTNTAVRYAAIYLNGFNGAFAGIHDNTGARNGLDALVFHGTVTDKLLWRTARKTGDPSKPLGYLVDGELKVTGSQLEVRAGDVVKVGNGGSIKLEGSSLLADDISSSGSQKIFTSLADDTVGVLACDSVLLPGPGCQAAAKGDWGGIRLSGAGVNAAVVNAAIRYGTTGILIEGQSTPTSGSSTFALVVSKSSFWKISGEAITARQAAISVTDSVFIDAVRGVNADLADPDPLHPLVPAPALRISGNRFMSTSAEAIVGQALRGRPVWITDNRIQGAATYGIRLLRADQLVLRDNNVRDSGHGLVTGASPFPAIYLDAVSADFAQNVRGNTGSGNGLEAIVFNGTVTSSLKWITPNRQSTAPRLGYLLDGSLTVEGPTLTVAAGDVVKTLGGTITIKGGRLDATDPGAAKIFTSFRDDSGPAGAAVSCPSVFATCTSSPSGGEWGGLLITDKGSNKGRGDIVNAKIDYADTGITIDSGPIGVGDSGNFRLTVAGGTEIRYASKDGINALDTPISMDGGAIRSAGSHGIIASFFSPANCPPSPPALPSDCVRFKVTGVEISGSGKDGIIANGLSGQPTDISDNHIIDATTYGIRLVDADKLTLKNNEVRKSVAPPATALKYPAIYLSNVKATFRTLAGTGPMVQGNYGVNNGLDAIVFHGEATDGLPWLTPGPPVSPQFGYLLDGQLTVDGTLTTKKDDVVKVLNGGIDINGGGLISVGTTFTSLKASVGMAACKSVFIPDPCPATPMAGDWTGITIAGMDSSFTDGGVFYASSGVKISDAKLDVTGATFYKLGGTALSSSGAKPLTVVCSLIKGNGTGVSADTAMVSESDVYDNVTADLLGTPGLQADYDYLGTVPKTTAAAVSNTRALQRPTATLTLTSDNPLAAADSLGNPAYGIGNLTLLADTNRRMNTGVAPTAQFVHPPSAQAPLFSFDVTGLTNHGWSTDHRWAPKPFLLDLAHANAGLNRLTMSGARGCVPPDPDNADSNLLTPQTKDFTAAILPTVLVASPALPASGPYGGSATLTAHLTANGANAGSQTVDFKLNGVSAGSAMTNSNGDATKVASLGTINAGTYPSGVQASYAGDPDLFYTPAPSAIGLPITAALTVNAAATTTAAPTSNASSTTYGQEITFRAKVTTNVTAGIDPKAGDGSVAFKTGTTTICAADVGTGSTTNEAKCSSPKLSVGSHNVSAVYTAAGGNFQDSVAATTVSESVSTASTSTSAPTSDTNPSTYGQTVTLRASVTSTYLNPGAGEGTVTFKEGSTPICTAGLGTGSSSNEAACGTFQLSLGIHTITAAYTAAGGNYLDSAAAIPLTQTVTIAPTTTSTPSTSNNPSPAGQPVTLSATVSAANIKPGSADGTVTFKEGATVICTGTWGTGASSNVATCTITTLSAGTHNIGAEFTSSSTNFQSSTSASNLSQTVNP